jgi:FG-GAP-like repeat
VDFDGDGRLDLLSGSNCCDSTAFHLFRRKADGSWAAKQRVELTPPEKVRSFVPTFVSAADYNGDGVPDFLCRASGGKGIVVALGPFKEGGSIEVSREIDFTPKDYVMCFAVADWDRDGKPDLLVRQVNHDTGKAGIYWYQNRGGPGFTKLGEGKLLLEITRAERVGGFAVGDWNGDGRLGLMVTRQQQGDGSVWFYPRE